MRACVRAGVGQFVGPPPARPPAAPSRGSGVVVQQSARWLMVVHHPSASPLLEPFCRRARRSEFTFDVVAFANGPRRRVGTHAGKDHKERHQTRIECVPAGFEEAADASIYFKKELQEAGAPASWAVVVNII